MDPLAPPWLEKIAGQGTGWALFCLSLLVMWALIKHIRELYKQSAEEGKQIAAALTRSTEAMEQHTTVAREMMMANRELTTVVRELDKRVELVSQQAKDRGQWEADQSKERAAGIERTIRDVLTGKG